jgi:hypothetical protein
MKLGSLSAMLLFVIVTAAYAQQNTFSLQRNKEEIGTGNYTLEKTKDGYKVDSGYHVNTAPRPDTAHIRMGSTGTKVANAGSVVTNAPDTEDIQQEHHYKLDNGYVYTGGSVRDLNTEITNNFSSNKAHTQITLNRMRTGRATTSSDLPVTAPAMVVPNYDASAVQALLYMATTHPAPNSVYYLIAPMPSSASETGAIQWSATADTTGTLDGKPIALHCYTFTFGRHEYTVYADEANTLMEVEIRHPNMGYIRTGFTRDAAGQ